MAFVAGEAPVIMESSAYSNVARTSCNMGDDGSPIHSFANWSVPASGLNAPSPTTTQFTIFYDGRFCTYDGIPAEKVHEIMLIAAANAKSTEMKRGTPFTSLIPTSPSSPQGTSNSLASQKSVCYPAEKNPICRLQEFPITRRQSLQRFLEKRRDRLGRKAPYGSSKVAENNLYADNAPNLVSLKRSQEGFHSSIAAT